MKNLLKLIAVTVLLSPIYSAQCEGPRLAPATLGSLDYFGTSVSISGDWLAVGAIGTNEAVYIYSRVGRSWFHAQTLTAAIGNGINFGWLVKIDGSRLAVAAASSIGSVRMYELQGSTWVLDQTIVASDAALFAFFGEGMDLDGDRLAVGARGDSTILTNGGAVYIFDHDGTQWVETAKLMASDISLSANLGTPVALDGDRFVAGAQRADFNGVSSAGIAYVFEFDGTSWIEKTRISPMNGLTPFGFPTSLDMEQDRFVAGLFNGSAIGTVFVYDLIGTTWTETQALEPADGVVLDEFGVSVEMDGDMLAVGSAQPFLSTGKVTVFEDLGAGYVDVIAFEPSGAELGDRVGFSCSIDGDLVATGSWFFDNNGITDTGSLWTYSLDDSLCQILAASKGNVSLSDGGTSLLNIEAGAALASQRYVVVGSVSGTNPGFPLGSLQVPLNIDSYFLQTLTISPSNPLGNSFGLLNAGGSATASFTVLPNADPSLVGLSVQHAAVIFSLGPLDILEVSNAALITLIP